MIYELILAGASFFHPQAQQDSLGVETVNGKTFVIHQVDEKETLYAISRRYGASIDAILASNPELNGTLEIGQIIKVPYAAKAAAPSQSMAQNGNIHRVEPKETMYSISRRYNITVDELKKWNSLTDNNLSVGQELIVRKGAMLAAPVVSSPAPASTQSTSPIPANGLHNVGQQETLFSVARQYGITVQQIKAWNSLQSDELKVGQSIYVVAPVQGRNTTQAVTQNETPAEVKVPEARIEEPIENLAIKTEQPVAEAQPKTQTAPPQTIRISESLKNSDEIMESGLAELIEGTEGNRKYLALHRTAPVGTILKVRNEMNNREVFVRVMGKLPDTAVNNKLIIKLSRSAYDRLGAIDPKFRVELTYYK